jgi:hypothetical protein
MRSPLASAEPPVPCAECLTRTPGIRWGDLCPDCLDRLRRRASSRARYISLLTSLLVVWYAWLRISLRPATRVWLAVIVVATYFLTRKIATQILMDLMRRSPGEQP